MVLSLGDIVQYKGKEYIIYDYDGSKYRFVAWEKDGLNRQITIELWVEFVRVCDRTRNPENKIIKVGRSTAETFKKLRDDIERYNCRMLTNEYGNLFYHKREEKRLEKRNAYMNQLIGKCEAEVTDFFDEDIKRKRKELFNCRRRITKTRTNIEKMTKEYNLVAK